MKPGDAQSCADSVTFGRLVPILHCSGKGYVSVCTAIWSDDPPICRRAAAAPFHRVDDRLDGSKLHSGGSSGARQVRTPQVCSRSRPEKSEQISSALPPIATDARTFLIGSSVPTTDSSSAASKFHHSITSSARTKGVGGIVNPSALAVFRLMTSSNLMLCWTGRSAGLAPLRSFLTYIPTR